MDGVTMDAFKLFAHYTLSIHARWPFSKHMENSSNTIAMADGTVLQKIRIKKQEFILEAAGERKFTISTTKDDQSLYDFEK
jgi:hypothetical protein